MSDPVNNETNRLEKLIKDSGAEVKPFIPQTPEREFITPKLEEGPVSTPEEGRFTLPEVDPTAWYEDVVNSILHTSDKGTLVEMVENFIGSESTGYGEDDAARTNEADETWVPHNVSSTLSSWVSRVGGGSNLMDRMMRTKSRGEAWQLYQEALDEQRRQQQLAQGSTAGTILTEIVGGILGDPVGLVAGAAVGAGQSALFGKVFGSSAGRIAAHTAVGAGEGALYAAGYNAYQDPLRPDEFDPTLAIALGGALGAGFQSFGEVGGARARRQSAAAWRQELDNIREAQRQRQLGERLQEGPAPSYLDVEAETPSPVSIDDWVARAERGIPSTKEGPVPIEVDIPIYPRGEFTPEQARTLIPEIDVLEEAGLLTRGDTGTFDAGAVRSAQDLLVKWSKGRGIDGPASKEQVKEFVSLLDVDASKSDVAVKMGSMPVDKIRSIASDGGISVPKLSKLLNIPEGNLRAFFRHYDLDYTTKGGVVHVGSREADFLINYISLAGREVGESSHLGRLTPSDLAAHYGLDQTQTIRLMRSDILPAEPSVRDILDFDRRYELNFEGDTISASVKENPIKRLEQDFVYTDKGVEVALPLERVVSVDTASLKVLQQDGVIDAKDNPSLKRVVRVLSVGEDLPETARIISQVGDATEGIPTGYVHGAVERLLQNPDLTPEQAFKASVESYEGPHQNLFRNIDDAPAIIHQTASDIIEQFPELIRDVDARLASDLVEMSYSDRVVMALRDSVDKLRKTLGDEEFTMRMRRIEDANAERIRTLNKLQLSKADIDVIRNLSPLQAVERIKEFDWFKKLSPQDKKVLVENIGIQEAMDHLAGIRDTSPRSYKNTTLSKEAISALEEYRKFVKTNRGELTARQRTSRRQTPTASTLRQLDRDIKTLRKLNKRISMLRRTPKDAALQKQYAESLNKAMRELAEVDPLGLGEGGLLAQRQLLAQQDADFRAFNTNAYMGLIGNGGVFRYLDTLPYKRLYEKMKDLWKVSQKVSKEAQRRARTVLDQTHALDAAQAISDLGESLKRFLKAADEGYAIERRVVDYTSASKQDLDSVLINGIGNEVPQVKDVVKSLKDMVWNLRSRKSVVLQSDVGSIRYLGNMLYGDRVVRDGDGFSYVASLGRNNPYLDRGIFRHVQERIEAYKARFGMLNEELDDIVNNLDFDDAARIEIQRIKDTKGFGETKARKHYVFSRYEELIQDVKRTARTKEQLRWEATYGRNYLSNPDFFVNEGGFSRIQADVAAKSFQQGDKTAAKRLEGSILSQKELEVSKTQPQGLSPTDASVWQKSKEFHKVVAEAVEEFNPNVSRELIDTFASTGVVPSNAIRHWVRVSGEQRVQKALSNLVKVSEESTSFHQLGSVGRTSANIEDVISKALLETILKESDTSPIIRSEFGTFDADGLIKFLDDAGVDYDKSVVRNYFKSLGDDKEVHIYLDTVNTKFDIEGVLDSTKTYNAKQLFEGDLRLRYDGELPIEGAILKKGVSLQDLSPVDLHLNSLNLVESLAKERGLREFTRHWNVLFDETQATKGGRQVVAKDAREVFNIIRETIKKESSKGNVSNARRELAVLDALESELTGKRIEDGNIKSKPPTAGALSLAKKATLATKILGFGITAFPEQLWTRVKTFSQPFSEVSKLKRQLEGGETLQLAARIKTDKYAFKGGRSRWVEAEDHKVITSVMADVQSPNILSRMGAGMEKGFDRWVDSITNKSHIGINAITENLRIQFYNHFMAKTIAATRKLGKGPLTDADVTSVFGHDLLKSLSMSTADAKTFLEKFRKGLDDYGLDKETLDLDDIFQKGGMSQAEIVELGGRISDWIGENITRPDLGDLPLYMDNALISTLLQFRSFSFAFFNKVLAPRMGRGPKGVAEIGALITINALWSAFSVEAIYGSDKDRRANAVLDSMMGDLMGPLGIPFEYATDIGAAVFDKDLPWGAFENKSYTPIADLLKAPTVKTLENTLRVGKSVFKGDFEKAGVDFTERIVGLKKHNELRKFFAELILELGD